MVTPELVNELKSIINNLENEGKTWWEHAPEHLNAGEASGWGNGVLSAVLVIRSYLDKKSLDT